jgi:hypothetical protein
MLRRRLQRDSLSHVPRRATPSTLVGPEYLDTQIEEFLSDVRGHSGLVSALLDEGKKQDTAFAAILTWGLKARKRYPQLVERGRVALTQQEVKVWTQMDLKDEADAAQYQVEVRLVRTSETAAGTPKTAWLLCTKPVALSARGYMAQGELLEAHGRHKAVEDPIPTGAALLEAAGTAVGLQWLALAKKRQWPGLYAFATEARQGLLFERFKMVSMRRQPSIVLDLDPKPPLTPTEDGADSTHGGTSEFEQDTKDSGVPAEGHDTPPARSRSTTRHRRHGRRRTDTSRSRRRRPAREASPEHASPAGRPPKLAENQDLRTSERGPSDVAVNAERDPKGTIVKSTRGAGPSGPIGGEHPPEWPGGRTLSAKPRILEVASSGTSAQSDATKRGRNKDATPESAPRRARPRRQQATRITRITRQERQGEVRA